jgi:hypothetical protein
MKLFFNSIALRNQIDPHRFGQFQDDISVIDINSGWPAEALPSKSIVLVENYSSKDVINLAVNRKVGHIIQINRGSLEREIALAAKMITHEEAFIDNPLGVVFQGPHQEIFRSRISSSKQKTSIKNEINNNVASHPVLSSLKDPILLIADELIMNSVFDAPKNSEGQFPHSKLPRATEIVLSESDSSEMVIAHDQHSLVIMCADPFGSLSTTHLLLRLQHCYNGTGNVMNLGAGGAGVGCQMMFDRSGGFCIGVKVGVRTVFCCLLPIKYRNLAPQLGSKNLNIVESL